MPGVLRPAAMTSGEAAAQPPPVLLIPINDQVRELQTILRDRQTTPADFVFYADRLIRYVVEEGLNQLPFKVAVVTTPTGSTYEGIRFQKGNCGVSISRGGEAMEKGLRDCCRSIRIGKILIEADPETLQPSVLYARLLPDIATRRILLLYPIMSTGQTVTKALSVLEDNGVDHEQIVLLTLFATPQSITALSASFPGMTIITTEINNATPIHFGTKYFGTD